jgi:glycosyltransferase involved in cell wall biosynthesis
MNVPTVSIGMPVYNSEEYLDSTLKSLLEQSYTDFELIISDNASTDNSREICLSYAAEDTRIRYVRNETNIGASDNYNATFLLSNGKYFKWASSNDLCGKNFLQRCVEVLDSRHDVVLAYPRARLFSDDPEVGQDYRDDLDLQDESPSQRYIKFSQTIKLNNVMNGLMRSECLKKTPLIKKFFSSDICIMAELALYGKFVEVPEVLFFRRMDEKTATSLKSKTELLRHYDPTLRDNMLMQQWKITLADFSATFRVPLCVGERAKVLRFLLRNMVWSRHVLGRELLDYFA